MSDNEYFCIHDDIFDRIQSNNQDRNILWGFISNKPNEDESQIGATEIHNDKIQNKKNTDGWNFIGIPEKEDGTFSDHEYFCVHDGIFDRIQ